jgi:hypothetical protein
LSSYEESGSSLFVGGGRAYLASDSLLTIVDVQDPDNPALLGSFDTTFGCGCDVQVEGGFAYVADGWGGLQIVDVSAPQDPSLFGFYDMDGFYAKSVTVENGLAYVASGNFTGLQIINATDPHSPTLGSSYNTPGDANDVALAGGVAYVADGGSGLQLISVSDPSNPALLGLCDTPGSAGSVSVAAGIAFVADGGPGLLIISVADPQNPALIAACDTPGEAVSLLLRGGYAFVADGDFGVQVLDVSDPGLPAIVASIQPHQTSYINRCYIHNDHLYVSDTNWKEISVYDISDLQSPALLNRYAWNMNTTGMFVSGGEFYTTNGASTLNIHDLAWVDVDDQIQPPCSTFQLGNYPNPFNPETTISYTLPASGSVSLEIYNSRGQLVRSLMQEEQPAGEHSLIWNGRDDSGHSVASGLYLYRIACQGKHETRKMLLLK